MRVLGVIAAAIVAITVSGCGAGDDDDVVAEPAAVTEMESDVEQSYLAYWDMVTRLESESPTQDPEIAQLTTGPALVKLTSELAMLELSDQVNRHGPRYEHQVLSVDLGDGTGSSEATLRDCFVNDTTVVDRETGDPLADQPGTTTALLEVTMVSREAWQVQTVETLDTFDGASPRSCTEQPAGG